VKGHDNTSYLDTRQQLKYSQAGCYTVTVIDKSGNSSEICQIACVDNCPDYIIPNVFTPNGDGINDTLKPIQPSRNISRIDMKIFNRWGQIVFETNDPGIRWNGKDMDTNKDCSSGTYYYIIIINQMHLEGETPRTISGSITIFR
jgi:gliding motility-associated-like protein